MLKILFEICCSADVNSLITCEFFSIPFDICIIEELISFKISLIFLILSEEFIDSFLISSATTANPFPNSPALAASIVALSPNKFVCLEMLFIKSNT
nr:hypothetical protein [Caloranaerobacter azorensis]